VVDATGHKRNLSGEIPRYHSGSDTKRSQINESQGLRHAEAERPGSAGQSDQHSVELLGYGGISDIRQGKYFEIAVDGSLGEAQARAEAERMARECSRIQSSKTFAWRLKLEIRCHSLSRLNCDHDAYHVISKHVASRWISSGIARPTSAVTTQSSPGGFLMAIICGPRAGAVFAGDEFGERIRGPGQAGAGICNAFKFCVKPDCCRAH